MSRQKFRHDSEPDVLRAVFGLKSVAVGNVKDSNAGAVPRAAARDAQTRGVIVVAVVVNIRMFAIISAVDGLRPLDDIASEMIKSKTIRTIS